MTVAFLADPMYYPIVGGTTRYIRELVCHLQDEADIDLRLFTLRARETVRRAAEESGYPPARSVTSATPRPLQYLLWHLGGFAGPERAATADADVVHTPILLVPPRGDRPLVVTILDLSFILFPECHTRRTRLIATTGLRRAVREADAFIAISEHTASDLVRLTGVPKERVYVTPLAAHTRFVRTAAPDVQKHYGIDTRYLLFVGTLEPRKNLHLLLRAFAALDLPDVKLVVAGARGWRQSSIGALVDALGIESRTVFTGYVDDEHLPALISGADVFVYPSRYEGFGLPVLEAMSCGTPVITTSVSSLPEVAGDAALLVDPDDGRGLRDAMDLLLGEPGLRDDLRGKGYEQAAKFSWARTAGLTATVYREALR